MNSRICERPYAVSVVEKWLEKPKGGRAQVVSEQLVGKLPDKSGLYELEDGSPVRLDLRWLTLCKWPRRSQEDAVIQSMRVIRKHGSLLPMSLESPRWRALNPRPDKPHQEKGLWWVHLNPRTSSGSTIVSQDDDREAQVTRYKDLVVTLDLPLDGSYYDSEQEKWVWVRYTPDYPESCWVSDLGNVYAVSYASRRRWEVK